MAEPSKTHAPFGLRRNLDRGTAPRARPRPGRGAVWPSLRCRQRRHTSVWVFVAAARRCAPTSPAPPRLASGPPALATRPFVLSPRTAKCGVAASVPLHLDQRDVAHTRALGDVEHLEDLAVGELAVSSDEHVLVRAGAEDLEQLRPEGVESDRKLVDADRVVRRDLDHDQVGLDLLLLVLRGRLRDPDLLLVLPQRRRDHEDD